MNKLDVRSSGNSMSSLNLYFGWWALLCYLTLGFTLEMLHGFKVGWYLEFETRRLMWTLGHAHGALLALVNIVFGIMVRVLGGSDAHWRRIATMCLVAATILLPAGFFLSGIHFYDADPGVGIVLVPLGAICLFIGVLLTAIKAPIETRIQTRDPAEADEANSEANGADDEAGTANSAGLKWD